MKRAFVLALAILGSAPVFAQASSAPTVVAQAQTSATPSLVAKYLLAARPAGEFPMLLRLNGSPTKLGVIVSAAGASTTNASTATPFTMQIGEVALVYCDAAAFCIEGSSASTTITNAAFGRSQPAGEDRYWIFSSTSAPVLACAGAAAFNCAVFGMR